MKILRVYVFVLAFVLVIQACTPAGELSDEDYSATVMAAGTPTSTPYPPFELSPVPLKAGYGFRAAWLELYFTDPTSPFAQENAGGVEGPLTAGIVSARESVDVSINSLGVNSITQALIRVHSRGIPVRVVIETNNADRVNPQELIDAGIPVVTDRHEGLMNNRFVVIDNREVWTGSVNYTSSGFFKEHNNLVRIISEEVAANYTKEFEEMFANDQFGPSVVPDTPYPQVAIQDSQIEVLFSPDDIVVARLAQLLGEAQQSIHFLSSSFSSDDLGNIIRERAAQGVSVSGVIEATQFDADGSEFDSFRQAGLDVRPGSSSALLDHNIIIIDGKIVVTGSYDFTNRSENENDENVMIIHNEKVAQRFMEEFQRIQAQAQQ
ncbi:MAG TPA: phospholipase D-like domain-containing protein [Anaerolineales bacterium]|nr:phospholipase D-like domain-containing protein [Anaerolineales bacterium]